MTLDELRAGYPGWAIGAARGGLLAVRRSNMYLSEADSGARRFAITAADVGHLAVLLAEQAARDAALN